MPPAQPVKVHQSASFVDIWKRVNLQHFVTERDNYVYIYATVKSPCALLSVLPLLTLGAHAQRGLRYCCCVCVCLSMELSTHSTMALSLLKR